MTAMGPFTNTQSRYKDECRRWLANSANDAPAILRTLDQCRDHINTNEEHLAEFARALNEIDNPSKR